MQADTNITNNTKVNKDKKTGKDKKNKKVNKDKKKKAKKSEDTEVYRTWSERIAAIFIGIFDAISNRFRKTPAVDPATEPIDPTAETIDNIIV